MTSYILCGNPKGGCCPIVEIIEIKESACQCEVCKGTKEKVKVEKSACQCKSCSSQRQVTITDDNKNVVIMTHEQYIVMCKKGCC